MNKDSRITLGIALLYFFNGMGNLFGPSASFAPMIFLDSFLLALLSLVFVALAPFKKENLLLLIFAICFGLQGCFRTGLLQHLQFEVANEIFFLVACVGFYVYAFWRSLFDGRTLMPLALFAATIGLRYAGVQAPIITATAIFSALWQVYLLARPDVAHRLGVLVKRFYLLMVLSVFFDGLYQLFLYLNFPQGLH